MYKQEAECGVCDSNFIVVNKNGEDISHCPFCGSPIEYEPEEEE